FMTEFFIGVDGGGTGCRAVVAGLDKAHYATSHAVLGLAGGNVEGAGLPIERGLPFAHANVEFDGVIALQGALGDKDGVVAILGTGTAYI
ncbi:hypothetical protein K3X38_14540, partial [Listeria monocytogenes]|nr:hypothetical protein [Listeria monocytogenes]